MAFVFDPLPVQHQGQSDHGDRQGQDEGHPERPGPYPGRERDVLRRNILVSFPHADHEGVQYGRGVSGIDIRQHASRRALHGSRASRFDGAAGQQVQDAAVESHALVRIEVRQPARHELPHVRGQIHLVVPYGGLPVDGLPQEGIDPLADPSAVVLAVGPLFRVLFERDAQFGGQMLP
jgi:hypothetical protein